MPTKKVIYKKMVKRRPGYLYYIDSDGSLVETPMNRKGGKKGRHVCSVKKKKTTKKKTAAKKASAKKKTSAKRVSSKKTVARKTTKRRR